MRTQEERFALLKKWKNETNLTYADIASVADIPVSTTQKIIDGKTKDPAFASVAPIVIALGHTLNEYYDIKTDDSKDVTMYSLMQSSYEQLLHEKDVVLELRLAEKDSIIATLIKEKEYLKNVNSKQTLFIICFIAFLFIIVAILVVDLAFPQIGRFN